MMPPTTPPRPLFFTVTGRDFGRSIAWARRTPNEITRQIRERLARESKIENPKSKISL